MKIKKHQSRLRSYSLFTVGSKKQQPSSGFVGRLLFFSLITIRIDIAYIIGLHTLK